MSDKKILHIIHGFGSGGAETWLVAATKYLKAHPENHLHFDFLLTGGVKSVFDEEVEKYGSKIYYLKYSFKKILSFRRAFKTILKHTKYDVIHDHQDFISGWHFFSAIGYLPPITIAHLHNPYNFVRNYSISLQRKFSYSFGRLLMYKLCTKITGTSDVVMDEYGYNKYPYRLKRVHPTYCGFDPVEFAYSSTAKNKICNEFNWVPDSTKIAIFVGRIGTQSDDTAINQKNPEFAFQIAKALVGDNEQWKFLFVGYKGEYGNFVENEIGSLGLNERIKLLGIRKDIPSIMSAADVLICTSFWEGLGMVVVEAQASGLPVIMSDSVPLEAIIDENLVMQKQLTDPVLSWVNAIKTVTQRKVNRLSFQDKIHQSPFSISNSVLKLQKLYR